MLFFFFFYQLVAVHTLPQPAGVSVLDCKVPLQQPVTSIAASKSLWSQTTFHAKKNSNFRKDGRTLTTSSHHFKNVEVFDSQYTESSNIKGNNFRYFGNTYDVPPSFSVLPSRTVNEATAACKKQFNTTSVSVNLRDQDLMVYFDTVSCSFKLIYVVSYFDERVPTFPKCFVDANNLAILKFYNNIDDVVSEIIAKGGNTKSSWDFYGLGATVDPTTTRKVSLRKELVTMNGDGSCTLETPNVKTLNLKHGTQITGLTSVLLSNCVDGFQVADIAAHGAEVNGGVNTEADAHAFGSGVYDMFTTYVGEAPLPFQLVMAVHYSSNYENAFWSGSEMYFGDGATTFFPLVSMDVTSHEIAHGYTQYHSNLVYSDQSGGMNEAFSDIAGEAGEYFMFGSNDWLVGADIFKATGQALRYIIKI